MASADPPGRRKKRRTVRRVSPLTLRAVLNERGFIQILSKAGSQPITRTASPISAGFSVLTPTASGPFTADYWVSTTGSDSNNGLTIDTPKRNFRGASGALALLSAGKKLAVRGGTYNEDFTGGWSSGSAGNPITIQAYPSETPVLTPSTLETTFPHVEILGLSYLTLDGLTLNALDSKGANLKINGGSTNIIINNCDIKDCWGNGVLCADATTHDITFYNCEIHGNGIVSTGGYGMYVGDQENVVVDHCHFYNNAVYACHFFNSGAGGANNTIKNCVVHDNGVMSGNQAGILMGGTDNFVYNNIIFSTLEFGIRIQFNSPANTKVFNNTIWNITATGGGVNAGIYVISGATNIDVVNNIVIEALGISHNGSGDNLTNHTTGVAADHFVNAAGTNFHLISTSAARNGGTDLSGVGGPTTDYDGLSRPQGSAWDIGAFEFDE